MGVATRKEAERSKAGKGVGKVREKFDGPSQARPFWWLPAGGRNDGMKKPEAGIHPHLANEARLLKEHRDDGSASQSTTTSLTPRSFHDGDAVY